MAYATSPIQLDPRLPQAAALLDCLDDVLAWVKDRDGRYCWVNQAFRINYGLDRARQGQDDDNDLIGKTDYDLSPPFLADQFRLDDEQVLCGKRIVNRIEMVNHPDGGTVWNVTNKIPLFDARGDVVGTAGVTRELKTPGPIAVVTSNPFGAVLEHLRDHYHASITNRELARLAHLSVRAFERKFQAAFHVTPQKYLRLLRMRLASRALAATRRPIAEVALACGFVDQSHFSREFRRYFGRTPRAYREHYAQDDAPGTKTAAREQ